MSCGAPSPRMHKILGAVVGESMHGPLQVASASCGDITDDEETLLQQLILCGVNEPSYAHEVIRQCRGQREGHMSQCVNCGGWPTTPC